MPSQPVFVHVSDEAWRGLDRIAYQFKCSQRAKLISRLPATPEAYIDHRPPNLVEQDMYQLNRGHFPMWSYEYRRYPRHMSVSDANLSKAVLLAEHFHIADHHRTESADRPLSRLGAFLEALGLGLLQLKGDWSSIVVAEAEKAARPNVTGAQAPAADHQASQPAPADPPGPQPSAQAGAQPAQPASL